MGYSYGRNARGNWVLACDGCGGLGGVRKRLCPHRVLMSAQHGPRGWLRWCPAPALCAACFRREGGTAGIHEGCAQAAADCQAEQDREQARLDSERALAGASGNDPGKGVRSAESSTDAARFVDFVDRSSWEVLAGIAARPMPVLTMDAERPSGMISGLRFHHAVRCGRCREVTYLYTDGGTITAGLESCGSRGTVRWCEQHRSGGFPSLPDTCPNPVCGKTGQPFTYWGVDYLSISPSGPEPIDLLNDLWTTLRARYPEQAAMADTVTSRYDQAPLPKRGYRR